MAPSNDLPRALHEIVDVLQRSAGSGYIGEPVSQLEHALQCAHFARKAGAPDAVVLGALLHDIGHLIAPPDAPQMEGLGVLRHEDVGADWLLARGFPSEVAELVRGHVQGKRYLTSRSASYLEHLSEASRRTLDFQGGPMTADEARAFEADPLFEAKVQIRKFDEAAKRTDIVVEPLDSYIDMMRAAVRQPRRGEGRASNILSPEQMRSWEENGFLVLRAHYDATASVELKRWVDELERRPETPGKWMKYFERSPAGDRMLCRIEDFFPYHAGLRGLLADGPVMDIVSQLMGEPAILFKEKINYKLPGGKGFAPHQDAPAFAAFKQHRHITLMVSVDATTIENGCLEVVRGRHREGTLAQGPGGALSAELVEGLVWEPVTTEPGDVLLFDSYTPHRSGPNRTDRPRRALYITYNRASEGDRRDDYYRDKRDKYPPDVERIPGKDYSAGAALYNLANPIDK